LWVVTTPLTCPDPSHLTRHWALAWQEMQACVLQADKDGTLLARRPRTRFRTEPLHGSDGTGTLGANFGCATGSCATGIWRRPERRLKLFVGSSAAAAFDWNSMETGSETASMHSDRTVSAASWINLTMGGRDILVRVDLS